MPEIDPTTAPSSTDKPVALITGGSGGIGAAIVRHFVRAGYRVLFSYQANATAADALCAELPDGAAVAMRADVSWEDDVMALYARLDRDFGRLDVLVNNAGRTGPFGRLEDFSAARMQTTLNINVLGPLLCSREAIARMSARHGKAGGTILMISSIAASLGSPGEYVDYAATKGAIDTLTTGLGRELAGDRIRVVGIRPGLIDTEIHAKAGDPERISRMATAIPLQRAGTPDDIAQAALWLASPEAAYVTACWLDVGGGR